MRRTLSSFAAVAIACSLALAFGGAARAAARLVGTVGPGFDIALANGGGTRVTTLRHGTYLLVVHDRSSIHDFHIKGLGLNKVVTTVGFVSTKTIRVTLKAGRYTFVCDPHSFVMHGSFLVR